MRNEKRGNADRTNNVDNTVPVRGSQNLIWLSLLPDTSKPFVGCHSTHLTSQPCPKLHMSRRKFPFLARNLPVNTLSTLLSANDHIHTLESSLAVAKRLSSGLKLIPRIASREEDPCHEFKLFMLGSKYLIIPVLSADARYAPEWVKVIAHIAVSCAWRMVSKWKNAAGFRCPLYPCSVGVFGLSSVYKFGT